MKVLARSLLVALALPAPGALAFAADLYVGPGHPYAQIDQAIAAAAPGDRIFVEAGLFEVFHLDKPLDVRGAGPGATRVTGFVPGAFTRVTGIPADATATIVGMSFDHTDPTVLTQTPVLEVQGCAGSVVLHSVTVNTEPMAYHLGPGLRAESVARLVVQDCVLRGSRGSQFGGVGDPGLSAQSSSLVLNDSVVEATDFSFGRFVSGEPGAPGAVLERCDAELARATVRGGSGAVDAFTGQGFPGGAGVELIGSTLVASGGPANLVEGGPGAAFSSAPGGPALRLSAASTATFAADVELQGGLDGMQSAQAPPTSVEPGSTLTAAPWVAPALALALQEVAIATAFKLLHSGEPGSVVLPAFSIELGPPLDLPGIDGTIHVDALHLTALAPRTLDGSGYASTVGGVPPIPSLAGAHAWFQAAENDGGVLRMSNPARLEIAL